MRRHLGSLFIFCHLLSVVTLAKVAPPFQAKTIQGENISLKTALKPNRVLLLTFWASWCSPCLEELNHVTTRMKNEPSTPLDLLTINVDTSETALDVKPTIKLHKFEMPVVLDPKHEIFAKYHQGKTLPFSVLIGPDGQIAETFNGYHEEMFTKIKQVISEKKSPLPIKEANAQKK